MHTGQAQKYAWPPRQSLYYFLIHKFDISFTIEIKN